MKIDKFSWIILLFGCIQFHVQGQWSTYDDLAFYADVMAHADRPEHRTRAHHKFYELTRQMLNEEGSFYQSLDSIPWISVQYPDDRSFRTISWQLKKDEEKYEYYSFLQFESGRLLEFKQELVPDMELAYATLKPEEYISQIIYQIKQFETEHSIQYLLFGYAQLDAFTKMKTVDVLKLDDEQIELGSAVFENPDGPDLEKPKRLVFKYSADALVSTTYNPGLDMIVFDHLIQRLGRMPGQGPTFLPDGSYSAYRRSPSGQWTYVDKLYEEILEEAPRPNPVNSDKTLDLFGRKKKN